MLGTDKRCLESHCLPVGILYYLSGHRRIYLSIIDCYAHVGADQLVDKIDYPGFRSPTGDQHLSGNSAALSYKSKEQMLRAYVRMVKLSRIIIGDLDGLLCLPGKSLSHPMPPLSLVNVFVKNLRVLHPAHPCPAVCRHQAAGCPAVS